MVEILNLLNMQLMIVQLVNAILVSYVGRFGMLGSIDANTGSPDLGWDTDQFPMDIRNCTVAMKVSAGHPVIVTTWKVLKNFEFCWIKFRALKFLNFTK